MCREKKCILLGWRQLRDYRKYKDEKQIRRALGGGPGNGIGAARSILRFVEEIQPSDVVIANRGRSSIVGIGVVKSEYLPPKSPKNSSESKGLPHARLVDWVVQQPIDFDKYLFSPPTALAKGSSPLLALDGVVCIE
jgi:predicted Mrr-cat superfamily restriction endonuclease